MIGLQLEPVDTWFFRDGTPFTMGEAPQEVVRSLFPPHPPTVVGALRAALAHGHGWGGRGPWSLEICNVLGDGPDTLGMISFDGPFLLLYGQPLFRVPRHIVGSANAHGWRPSSFLRPGDPVACDLGCHRLPEVLSRDHGETDTLGNGNDYWLTRDGVNSALSGCLPRASTIVRARSLWLDEPRIGLRRTASRTAEDGMLYSTRHVRPVRGVGLGVWLSGLPNHWGIPSGKLLPFGGESRLAACREWWADVRFDPSLDRMADTGRAALIALSPLDLEQEILRGHRALDGPEGFRVVSACLDRPQRVGGWDSLARCPLPVRSVLPPGSVLFCELSHRDRIDERGDGLVRIGKRREWGFGLAALGVWPE
ncbi:MAG: hypothetical protein OXP28_12000 [Gammaproteobacteria bacterium]|nr:hypothetical protein [Gammaproteobacteria bacterium]